jgi:hypothetical protein
MAVTVHFIDGRTETFPLATSATNRGPVFTIARYDKAKLDLVEVSSFMSDQVTVAEVFDGAVLKNVISGSGRTNSN